MKRAPPLLFPSPLLLQFLLFLFSVVCDQVDQVVPAHQVDDIDEVHELDPVHQVDHKDEYTSPRITYHIIADHDITWVSTATFFKRSGDRCFDLNDRRLSVWKASQIFLRSLLTIVSGPKKWSIQAKHKIRILRAFGFILAPWCYPGDRPD